MRRLFILGREKMAQAQEFVLENDHMMIHKDNKPCYPIVFAKDFSKLADAICEVELNNKRACIITDSKVNGFYADQVIAAIKGVCKEVLVFSFPDGEKNKNLDTVKAAYTFLIENHFERKDFVVALGGGVVGDLAGFCASTFLRGISFIQIPTSLIAQSDSSIGGKTGVDFDGYKNMVGAFCMPKLVYMNVNTLKTLEDRHFFNGFAEVMKHGLIKDHVFYEWLIENMYEICERDEEVLLEMIKRSSNIKRLVVEKDPYEKKDRALLNFGHTIGHAIEKTLNFNMLHGECVALGCVAAAFISWKKELLNMDEYYEIRDMFVPFYLPISIDKLDREAVLSAIKSDKKNENGIPKFILLKKVGKAVIDTTVTEDDINDALNEIIFDEEAND